MAERKSGPVKPPVIEAKARRTTPAKPADDTPARAIADARSPEATAVNPPPTETKPAIAAGQAEEIKSAPTIAEPAKPEAAEVEPGKPEPAKPEPAKPAAAEAGPVPPAGKPAVPNAGAQPSAARPETRPADKPIVPERKSAAPSLVIAGVVGGIVGLGLAYGLAAAGYWPSAAPAENPEVAALRQQLAEIAGTSEEDRNTLAAMRQAISRLQDNPAPQPVDLAPLQGELTTLSNRLDAVAAGASSADAGALSANLGALDQRLNDLSSRVDNADQSGAGTTQTLQTINDDIASLRQQLAQTQAQPSPEEAIGPALRLPLVLSGLEGAFGSARPYAAELDSLRQIRPDTQVPQSVIAAAPTGLVPAADLAERFERALPDILASRPSDPDASWQDQTLGWFRTVLALRPSGDVQGDAPEAVLARLEQAMARRDMAGADQLFGALPEGMRNAAGTLPADVKAQAEAQAFIVDLRLSALEPQGANR